jgi:HAE1 family hydrophobic/amphiphilic exporter-1
MELMSSIDMPMMIITTVYPGASPEDVDKLITGPIEDAVSILSHVKDVQSTSSENMGMTLVQYEYGTDMDQAYDDLKKKMDSVKSSLPKEAEAPNYLSMNINEQPCITLSINNPMQDNLYNYVQNDIVPELEKVSGVASVSSSGGQKQYIKVELIPEKLKQYKLSMQTIAQTVQAAKFTYPAGNTNYGSQKLSVSSSVDYENVQDLQNMPIITGTGDTIYLKDIAVVDMSQEEKSSIGRYNGQDTISLSITKNQNESAVTVSRRIKAQIEALKQRDSHLEVITIEDDADNIISSLKSVFETMIMAVIISMIIIFIFFGDWKASLIVGTSIPLSILAALVAMCAMGYSLNMITMSALVLGVGMMVDNSIVVLENIYAYRQRDAKPRVASILGSQEMVSSITGSTLTSICIFAPMLMFKKTLGIMGQMFNDLAWTIIFSLTCSLLVAMCLVPVLTSKYLKIDKIDTTKKGEGKIGEIMYAINGAFNTFFAKLDEKYAKGVSFVLHHSAHLQSLLHHSTPPVPVRKHLRFSFEVLYRWAGYTYPLGLNVRPDFFYVCFRFFFCNYISYFHFSFYTVFFFSFLLVLLMNNLLKVPNNYTTYRLFFKHFLFIFV